LLLHINVFLSLIIGFVVAFLAYIINEMVSSWQRTRRERQREEDNRRARQLAAQERLEQLQRQLREAAQKQKRHQPIDLVELTLVIKNRQNELTTGLAVNTRRDTAIVPMAVVEVYMQEFAKQWPDNRPIRFELVDPNGRIAKTCTVTPQLVTGINRIYNSAGGLKISNQTAKGDWNIRIWISRNMWGQTGFFITDNEVAELQKAVGADFERTAKADSLAPKTPVDLNDLLE